MVRFSIDCRIDIVEFYIKTCSIKETKQMFVDKYSNIKPPSTSTIQDLYKKWRSTGSVANVIKTPKRPTVKTPSVVEKIRNDMMDCPETSIRKLSQQVGVSRTTCHRVLKELHLRPLHVPAKSATENTKANNHDLSEELSMHDVILQASMGS